MFLGNHFLAEGEEGGKGEGDDDGTGDIKDDGGSNGGPGGLMSEQMLARHKELFQRRMENGSSQSGAEGAGGGAMKQLSHQMGMAAAAAAAAQHGLLIGDNPAAAAAGATPQTDMDSRYSCRLCGKVSGNGASLFAHLLYPHYAHLWRDEVPHRAPR